MSALNWTLLNGTILFKLAILRIFFFQLNIVMIWQTQSIPSSIEKQIIRINGKIYFSLNGIP